MSYISFKWSFNPITENSYCNEWMNEFLEQLVRVLTNAYSRSQRMFGERVSPGPQIIEAILVFLVAGGQLL